MRGIILFFILNSCIVSFISCQSRTGKIADRYNSQPVLHQNVADSLMLLSEKTGRRIVIKKYDIDRSLVFNCYFKNNANPISFSYDSLDRKEPLSGEAAIFDLSPVLVRDIRSVISYAIQAESAEVFFALGYIGGKDRCDGISIFKKDTILSGDFKKLGSNAYVNGGVVH